MRRWNGWGSEETIYPLPASAAQYLAQLVGSVTPPAPVPIEAVIAQIPEPRLPEHPLISTDPLDRLRHARGQSLPDWLELRTGMVDTFPDAVAYPLNDEDVRLLVQYAVKEGIHLIPYGGGTSVVGHINPIYAAAPVLTVDMQRMNHLIRLDETSHLATFGAGVAGPDLEAQLRAHGYTLGHFPQSFELSTLGGWIATRSSGQQSLRYGRIEKLFAGGWLESPNGSFQIPPFPASAAGPDLREVVLGSEGRLGIITEATMRISRLPEKEEFYGYFFPDFEQGQAAVRELLQTGVPLSMLRLSTPTETQTTLSLAGHENLINLLEGVLSLRGLKDQKCMLIAGFTGPDPLVRTARGMANAVARKYGGVNAGRNFGEQWYKNRFRSPYLRNTLWEQGYGLDTLETAIDWAHVSPMVEAVETALKDTMAGLDERIHVFTHLSHTYPYGSSVYTTYLFRLADDPAETLHRWQLLKANASQAVIANNGTISHQHGVGTDHLTYLPAEKGLLGMAAIADICHRFDPQGIMNPGKLVA